MPNIINYLARLTITEEATELVESSDEENSEEEAETEESE